MRDLAPFDVHKKVVYECLLTRGDNVSETSLKSLILAAGCFWGVEELFRSRPGVIDTEVGYTGGDTENPTYDTVKKGDTGHAEALRITFDPTKTNYQNLFRYFFSIHDPTTLNRQGNDRGTQYRSAIFYQNNEEKLVALTTLTEIKNQKHWQGEVVTEVLPLKKFYSAEKEHQDYLQKHPGGYTCHFERYSID